MSEAAPSPSNDSRDTRDRPSAPRNLAALVSATGLANLADGVMRVGLPLVAARLTSDPVAIGALVACFSAPWVVASFHVGVMVDRLDRRLLLCAAHLARLTATGMVAATYLMGILNLSWLYVAALALGASEVVAMTSETAIVPMATASDRIPAANAWITALETLGSESVGPALGGLLFALGTAWILLPAASAFLLSAAGALSLRGDFRARRTVGGSSILADGKAGLAYLMGRRDLFYMTLLVGIAAACWSAWRTLILLFAAQPGPMHLDPRGYGVLVAMLGVGGLAGAMLAGRVVRWVGRKAAMSLNVVGTAAMLGMPVVTADSVAVGVAIFAAGFGSSVWSINSRTIVQQTVPTTMVGRFYSIYRLLSWGCLPIGAMAAGAAARSLGLVQAFAVMATVATLQAVPFLLRFHPARAQT